MNLDLSIIIAPLIPVIVAIATKQTAGVQFKQNFTKLVTVIVIGAGSFIQQVTQGGVKIDASIVAQMIAAWGLSAVAYEHGWKKTGLNEKAFPDLGFGKPEAG
jgi:hypothetical protein